MTEYMKLGPGELLAELGADATKWADAFYEAYPHIPKDIMVGWFANAMMNMWDVTNSNITHDPVELVHHISALVRNHDAWQELNAEQETREGKQDV